MKKKIKIQSKKSIGEQSIIILLFGCRKYGNNFNFLFFFFSIRKHF